MPTFLRRAAWHEVAALFFQGDGDAVRNAAGWAKRYGLPVVDYRACPVTLESWTDAELRDALAAMAEVEPRMVDEEARRPPRLDGLPAVVVRFGNRVGMIDGKHRANGWKHRPGQYAVLVIHA